MPLFQLTILQLNYLNDEGTFFKNKMIMKYIFGILLFFFSVANVFAQKETFDLVTYTVPKGWKKEVTDVAIAYSLTNNKDKSWCQIGIYKSMASKGSIDQDFNSEWQILVTNQYKTKTPSHINEAREADGWKIKAGWGSFTFNNQKAYIMLTTFSGYNKSLSIVATFNNEKYIPDVQNLITSLDLKKPGNNTEVVINNKPVTNLLVIGSWGKSNSVSQLYNRYGTYSYNKQQYFFYANGSYTFLGKNYSEDYAETLLIKESGTFTINGDMLTVIPKTNVIEAWSKKGGGDNWGQLISSQKKALEKVTYQVSIKDNHLLLSTSKETTRDGRFSNGNFYSYGPPGTFTVIKLPGQ